MFLVQSIPSCAVLCLNCFDDGVFCHFGSKMHGMCFFFLAIFSVRSLLPSSSLCDPILVEIKCVRIWRSQHGCISCVAKVTYALNFYQCEIHVTFLRPIYNSKIHLKKYSYYIYRYIEFSVNCIEYNLLFHNDFELCGNRCFMSFFACFVENAVFCHCFVILSCLECRIVRNFQ
jgi:hypothetical protein